MYVVATPLGNLQDMSLRALAVLRAVDAVACEDTRHSQRLLDAFGIKTRLVALHEHNEQAAAGLVIRMLEEGKQVALITDAGTPAVSDPGARAVARVQDAGFPVVPVPGASAPDGDPVFLFNTTTRTLYYDSDGDDSGAEGANCDQQHAGGVGD